MAHTDPLAASIAANVRAEMARVGERQADLATALGITQQALSARLAGPVEFRPSELARIANHYGVPVLLLIGEVAA